MKICPFCGRSRLALRPVTDSCDSCRVRSMIQRGNGLTGAHIIREASVNVELFCDLIWELRKAGLISHEQRPCGTVWVGLPIGETA